MEIVSISFVLLAIASIFIFYLLNHKLRIGYLAILSCAFIASFSYYLLLYILFYSYINYFIGLRITSVKNRKTLFRTGLFLNLLQLFILRYSSFVFDPINSLLRINIQISVLSEIIIPVGISYFTLQGIGYLINLKMGWEKPEEKFLNFFLYITFYPKFLSGPIERSNHFLPQLKAINLFNEQQLVDGIRIALFGFFKKVAIANQLAPYITNTYSNISPLNGDNPWLILLIGPLYLYFDFSGYTDIAIGLAKAFGIDLLPNFKRPFFSENITTFWKRFHISLSSWFNDYVFRQVSFKYRKLGVYASIIALLITWTLFGIWHGAGWNFMILGFIQALAIIYEFFTKKWRMSLFSRMPVYLKIWLGRIFTYLFFCISLVFFFSNDMDSVFSFFSKLTDTNSLVISSHLSRAPYMLFIYIPLLLFLELLDNDFQDIYCKFKTFFFYESTKRRILRWLLYSIIIVLILVVKNKEGQFVYVNF